MFYEKPLYCKALRTVTPTKGSEEKKEDAKNKEDPEKKEETINTEKEKKYEPKNEENANKMKINMSPENHNDNHLI